MNEFLTINVPRFARVTDYVGPWAILPEAGAALWDKCRSMDLVQHVADAAAPVLKSEIQTTKAANGQNIAVVYVTGPMMKSVGSSQAGTSTVQARREIRKAAADPDVSAILVAIDSPGGTVSGTADLASEVKAATGKKPVWAYIDDMGASAAYWTASQADKIFANNSTALVGSIGTLSVVYDLSKAAEDAGVKTIVFGTGPLKGTGVQGAAVTDDQQSYIRGIVEDSQVAFDAAVQKGRNLTDRQLASVKTGGVFSASEALDRKLIDGIKSFDAVLNELGAEAKRFNKSNPTRADAHEPQRRVNVNETENPVVAESVTDAKAVLATMRAEAATELKRHAAILKVCAKHPDIAAKAIEEGWAVDKAELTSLKADLSSHVQTGGPYVNTGAGKWAMGKDAAPGVSVNEAIECAMQASLGRNVEKTYKPEVCQAARESFRDIGLQGAVMLAAVQNGYPGRPGERISKGNFLSVIRHAKGLDGTPGLLAASSTIGMGGILGSVANKEIVAGYMEEDNTWREIAAIKSVSNFQQVTTYRMLDDMEFEELGADGKIKHGTAGQESYTRQAKTYAKMFAVTRQNIINDDLGAFDDVRTRIGRGQGKKLNKVFWTAFMSNLATTFTSSRTNYISGSTTNLGTDGVGIGLGVLAFRKMTSPAGVAPTSADGGKHVNAGTQNPVGANPGGRPEILLVPPELEGNAEVIYRNQNLGSVKNSDANIYQNKYRPVVAWQLSNSSYSGYSTTQWFLLNNPSFLATMAVSFLNGQQTPTVEEQPGDFDELCYQWRAYGDFGCDVAEYLGGLHSKGAA